MSTSMDLGLGVRVIATPVQKYSVRLYTELA